MGLLAGKKILITGAMTSNSLAFGIAQACRREGADLAFTYQDERLLPRLRKIVQQFETELIFPCDVADDEQIDAVFACLGKTWDCLDGLVHSIGYAPQQAIEGDFLDGLSRESFHVAHDISAYSFPALAKAALPMMSQTQGALLTLSYIGSSRCVPTYNTMGLAKASLEASVRYLAHSLGRHGLRANAISAAPIRTVAASSVGAFEDMLAFQDVTAPLSREVTALDVGNVSAFLLSDLSSGITGQTVYVDGGLSSMSGFVPRPVSITEEAAGSARAGTAMHAAGHTGDVRPALARSSR